MCLVKSPKMPKPTPLKAAVQQAVEEQDPTVVAGRDSERRRRMAAASNTVLTSSQGATGAAPIAGKTLLGQ